MIATAPPRSLLLDPDRHPLRPPADAAALGATIVFAPHPDDESLGCGGLLALLADAGISAQVVVMTDGSRSHPGSVSHPAPKLAALREQETADASSALGLPAGAVQFLRFRDCELPGSEAPEFADAVLRVREIVLSLAPETILIPWRRDPHCDHEATYQILRAAVSGLGDRPRWLEYPVWAWPRAASDVAPHDEEGSAWRLDITPVLARKVRAISQHRSQLGLVISDDPAGFVLEAEMVAHFHRPWELFIAPADV